MMHTEVDPIWMFSTDDRNGGWRVSPQQFQRCKSDRRKDKPGGGLTLTYSARSEWRCSSSRAQLSTGTHAAPSATSAPSLSARRSTSSIDRTFTAFMLGGDGEKAGGEREGGVRKGVTQARSFKQTRLRVRTARELRPFRPASDSRAAVPVQPEDRSAQTR